MNFIATDLLLYLTLSILVIVSMRAIYLRKIISQQRSLQNATNAKLETALVKIEELKQIEKKYNTFSTDLEQAAISSKVQQTPRVLNSLNGNLRPPERYKYIHSLTQQGISSSEIATILAISSQEADQLVNLANISNK